MVVLLNSDCLLPIKHLSEIYHSPKSRVFVFTLDCSGLPPCSDLSLLTQRTSDVSHRLDDRFSSDWAPLSLCYPFWTDLRPQKNWLAAVWWSVLSMRLRQRYYLVRGTFCNEEDVCLSDLIINNYLVASQSFLCDWLVATKLTVRRIASKTWNNLP